jgi:hypothetical protein
MAGSTTSWGDSEIDLNSMERIKREELRKERKNKIEEIFDIKKKNLLKDK